MDNSSNYTNGTTARWSSLYREFYTIMAWTVVVQSVFCIVGTVLNAWLLASILTSRDLRVRMRNQLICNMTILHLVQTLLKNPVIIAKAVVYVRRDRKSREFYCHTYSIISSVEFIQSFIADWLMVFILIIFIAHIVDFDPQAKLTPQAIRIAKGVMHVAPWLVAIIVTPIGISFATRWYPCLLVSFRSLYIFEIVYTLIPTGTAILLTAAAYVLRYRSFSRGSSTAGGNMGVQLIGRGPEIDNILAYTVAMAVCVTCEICNLVFAFEIMNWKYRGLSFQMAAYTLSDSRVILMVFPWLLLPDIRQRIKSWRPWKPHASGIDLTMTYGKEP